MIFVAIVAVFSCQQAEARQEQANAREKADRAEERFNRETAFEIETTTGVQIAVPSKGYTVVCFLGIECPLSKLYGPRLNELAAEFESANFRFVAINSNQQDSLKEWQAFAKEYLKFPVCKDQNNILADQLSVARNPEVLVFDDRGSIRYRGRIDNQFSPGVKKLSVGRKDLRLALEQLKQGQNVEVPVTKPEGCLIGRVRPKNVNATFTYARDISRIFQKHCIECHRSGAIGPFVLDDYEEAIGWGDMIVETIDNQRMPPWHAAPTHGDFVNARRLTESEKNAIRTWVADGAPYGDKEDLPEPVEFVEKWRLPREPDLVIPMSQKPFQVPADGTVDYQYFVVDPGFKEDKWVNASEVIPGNPAVVHHSLVFIKPPDGKSSIGANLLGGYVPGQLPIQFDSKRAQRVPAGSKLVFQQHYTPNGSPESDTTRIGLVFMDKSEVKEELYTIALINQDFEILPNQEDAVVKKTFNSLPPGGKLISISPHMHYRGKSFMATLKKTSGESETVLSVPNYDFNWQHIYEFRKPLDLSNIEAIQMEVHFDNSKNNPFNPNPEEYVVWGDQTWEEMAVGFFNVTRPVQGIASRRANRNAIVSGQPELSKSAADLGAKFASSLIEKNDANRDGSLDRKEMPWATRAMFRSYDTNGDGKATQEEISLAAAKRYNQIEMRKNQR